MGGRCRTTGQNVQVLFYVNTKGNDVMMCQMYEAKAGRAGNIVQKIATVGHLVHLFLFFSERKNSVNPQIPHSVRDQLTKLMNSHPEFSACAGTTAAFIMQTCKLVLTGK